jgi:Bacterial regulatory proteins, tetR family
MDAAVKTEYSSFMIQSRRRIMNPEGKKEAVLAAGEKLFASQGYTRTTIADIASAADVAVGSVYRNLQCWLPCISEWKTGLLLP